MTEAPNLPEREPEDLTKGEAARVTHIRSRGFTPRAPAETTLGPLTPVSSRVEPIISAPVIAEEAVPGYIPQEPAIEHKDKRGIPLKAKLAGAVATLAVTAAGVFGYNKINSSEDEAQVNIVPPAPTLVIPTPEDPQPTAEPTKEVEKYPYEIGWEQKFGNITVAVTTEMQNRTECPPPNGFTTTDCGVMHEVVLNTQDYPNNEAQEKLTEGFLFGYYRAWQSRDSSRSALTFEQYKKKFSDGEDLSFTIERRGLKGTSALPVPEIRFDPRKETKVVYLGQPKGGVDLGGGGSQTSYREMEKFNVIEIYTFAGGGVGDHRPAAADPESNLVSLDLERALAVLADKETFDAGRLTTNSNAVLIPKIRELDQFFIPKKSPSKWNGIIQAR